MTEQSFRAWLTTLADADATVPARVVLDRLPDRYAEPEPTDAPALELVPTVESTWREKLWTAPAETRIGVRELAEALGRSTSWVYKRFSAKADHPIPHRRIGGEVVVTVKELREWIRRHEQLRCGAQRGRAA
ncbi:MAG: helix-turn-helix domain-containing protein [Gemmatimonadota bacterium]|nr:helix-turn-helix domain-containing protein [Gemmatimonadota bacterium]